MPGLESHEAPLVLRNSRHARFLHSIFALRSIIFSIFLVFLGGRADRICTGIQSFLEISDECGQCFTLGQGPKAFLVVVGHLSPKSTLSDRMRSSFNQFGGQHAHLEALAAWKSDPAKQLGKACGKSGSAFTTIRTYWKSPNRYRWILKEQESS